MRKILFKLLKVIHFSLLYIFSLVGLFTVSIILIIALSFRSAINHYINESQTSTLPWVASEQKGALKKDAILAISLEDGFKEDPSGVAFFNGNSVSVHEVCYKIRKAAEDEKVKSLLIIDRNATINMAHAEEVANAIKYFRDKSKKHTYFFAYDFGFARVAPLYTIASSTEHVYMQPHSSVGLTPADGSRYFYKKLFDEQHLVADFIEAGGYKSAPHMYTKDKFTPLVRENLSLLTKDINTYIQERIAFKSQLPKKEITQLLNEAPIADWKAFTKGLIDGLYYSDEVKEILKHHTALDGERFVAIQHYSPPQKDIPENKIPVIVLDGEIVDDGRSGKNIENEFITPLLVKERLTLAGKIQGLKALVVRVNSPGGSSVASETIWRSIKKFKEEHKIPVVISMGPVAASGGYYIACAGDEIVANKTTITGSIGVFMGKFVTSGFAKKWGVTHDALSPDSRAHMISPDRPFSKKERVDLAAHVKETYRIFKQRVSDARSITMKDVEAVAQGQVWTGMRAKDKKLVDHCGGLYEALEAAKTLAEIEAYQPLFVAKPQNIKSYLRHLGVISETMMKAASYFGGLETKVKQLLEPKATMRAEAFLLK